MSDFASSMNKFQSAYRTGIDVNLAVDIDSTINSLTTGVAELRKSVSPADADIAALVKEMSDCFIRCGLGALSEESLSRNTMLSGVKNVPSLLACIAESYEPGVVIVPEAIPASDRCAIEAAGHRTIPVGGDNDGMRLDGIKEELGKIGDDARRLRFVLIPTVNKVIGTVMQNMRKQIIASGIAALEADQPVAVVFDNTFFELVHSEKVEQPVLAITALQPVENIIEIGSLSEVLVPGADIGWLMASDAALRPELLTRLENGQTRASDEDIALATAFLPSVTQEHLDGIRKDYRIASVAVMRSLKTYFGGTLTVCKGGEAGFFYLATLASTHTAIGSPFHAFTSRETGDPAIDTVALESGERAASSAVLYLPGSECFHPDSPLEAVADRAMRISYGYEDVGAIQKGVQIMRHAIEYDLARAGQGSE